MLTEEYVGTSRNTQVYVGNTHEYRGMLRNALVQLGIFRTT